MSSRTSIIYAACLTAPAPGGIAVVQVVGADLPGRLGELLRARRPLDWQRMFAGELRLCEIVDGPEVLDEAIIAARQLADRRVVLDLNTHGGPRVVQRVLMLLRDRGVRIVEPPELARRLARTGLIQQEADAALLHAHTRSMALWLARMRTALPASLRVIAAQIEQGEPAAAAAVIESLLAVAPKALLAVRGVRVVFSGDANVGKSTLANALAGEQRALVSDRAGTTRDWVEHPTAIDGLPFVLIDTAGIRPTGDPLEREAIRRTHLQRRRCDLEVRVLDATMPLTPVQQRRLTRWADSRPASRLLVWNKADMLSGANRCLPEGALLVSGKTGLALDALRCELRHKSLLADFGPATIAPFTARQIRLLRQVLSALRAEPPHSAPALAIIARLTAAAKEYPESAGV